MEIRSLAIDKLWGILHDQTQTAVLDQEKIISAWTAIVNATRKSSKRKEYATKLYRILLGMQPNGNEKLLKGWESLQRVCVNVQDPSLEILESV